MLTIEQLQDYVDQVESMLATSLEAATNDLPNIRDTVNKLWVDISRFGPAIPSFAEVHLPGLGDFQVPPPPPPPPPPPRSWVDKSVDWVASNPWTLAGLSAGAIGAGLLVGYSTRRTLHSRRVKTTAKTASRERRKVIVVLGGDSTPLGLALVAALEKSGFIVIASVATPEAVELLESRSHGYVRALVLDPSEPASVPIFIRSLSSTLSRRFPLNAAGDPHASLSSHVYIHSVISLLTLPSTSIHAPLEQISLRTDYLPYLDATHITPLSVIQAILPMLRSNPARTKDAMTNDSGAKSIIVCLPAADTRVGLLFSSTQAMSAAATLRGVEILRREISVASLTDKTESMKNIKVVVVDVGTFDAPPSVSGSHLQAMEGWTASEKLAYGPAFASISHEPAAGTVSMWKRIFNDGYQYGVPRRPTDPSTFVDAILGVVDGGRRKSVSILGINYWRLRTWIRGERFSVGAGATTYKLASLLPSVLLDIILNIPHFLISLRNSLLPTQPFIVPPTLPPTQPPLPPKQPLHPNPTAGEAFADPTTDHESLSGNEASASEAGSEADVESNSGAEGSWIRLNPDQQ